MTLLPSKKTKIEGGPVGREAQRIGRTGSARYKKNKKNKQNKHKYAYIPPGVGERRGFEIKNSIKLTLVLFFFLASMAACSVTSLQCGVDGESSFVVLNTTPKILSQNARNMAQLCAFGYEEPANETS